MKTYLQVCCSLLFMLLLFGCGKEKGALQSDRYMVGAHYYSWYPSNWGMGSQRRVMDPQQSPMLGYYDSWDVKTVEQHIAWCSQYGVDFLTLDWWNGRDEQSEYIHEVFLKAENIGDIKFCIFYETWSLNFDYDTGASTFGDEECDLFVSSLMGLADEFFDHPSYLRVDGRPVVILYLTRTLAGDYRSALKRLRRKMAKAGHDVFLIADEIFWEVTPVVKKGTLPHPLVTEPQVKRARCFDAIFGYNMYENEIKSQAGYGVESSYMADVTAKYDEYKVALGDSVYYVPDIMPGYNDRHGRLELDHHVIPRKWSAESEEGSFFSRSLDTLAIPYIDERLNMFLITSWNEWNEDTAIEPVTVAPGTAKDLSPTGSDYTKGFEYTGYGMTYLEILRDRVVAVYGRLLDADGQPRSGVEVEARQGDVVVRARSDSRGYFRISRLRLKPGECEVRVGEDSWKVDIKAESAVEVGG